MTGEAGVMLKDRKIRRFHRSYTVDFMGLGGDGLPESGFSTIINTTGSTTRMVPQTRATHWELAINQFLLLA